MLCVVAKARVFGWWAAENPFHPLSPQVFYAPHIARLSAALGARFEISYTLRGKDELISNVSAHDRPPCPMLLPRNIHAMPCLLIPPAPRTCDHRCGMTTHCLAPAG